MALDPALIHQLTGRHPARRMSFDELRAGLLAGVAAKCINVSRDGNLELFGYTSQCQFEQQWDLFSLIARGLILDVAEKRIVATPFPKFFNFNEGGVALPNEPFEASEKIDGSLGILFHHQGAWRVSTRGQLTSDQGAWATKHAREKVQTAHLSPGTTYLVEIVYPENRIVIAYDFAGLVLLSAYDQAGDEIPRMALEETAVRADLRVAKVVPGSSFEDLLAVAQNLTRFEEGFVIRFQSGLRVKLKGEAYCRVHKLICRCTPLALWEAMMNGEDLPAMRHELPEEMRRDFDEIYKLLLAQFDATLEEVRTGSARFASLNDKELGFIIQNPPAELTETQRKFLFACRKKNFLEAVHHKGDWREKLFKHMRPDRNFLAGYIASNAMNRFAAEMG